MLTNLIRRIDGEPPLGTGGPDERQRSPFQRRGFLLSAALVTAALVGGTAFVAWPGQQPGPPRASAPAVQPQQDETAGPAKKNEGKGPASETIPTTPPDDVTWELVSGVAVPHSETAGPTEVNGAVHAGYAHTPEGALMAALNIGTRRLLTPGDGWREVVEQQVMPGPGKEAFLRNRAQVTHLTPPPGGYGQVAGFKFVAYSPDLAVIQFASKFTGRTFFQVTTATLRWHKGDWRLVLQPDGGESASESTITSLSGFVPFAGV